MQNLAFNLGLKKGWTGYGRFIILGRSRVGSNLLRSLLNAHTHIETYGEIFRNREAMDWDHLGRYQAVRQRKALLQKPTKFLETQVFGKYPQTTTAVGFKIFYYHAQEGDWQPVWPYLEAQTDLHVIHIKRRNILKTHLSRKRAELTDSWVNTTGAEEKPVSITLDYDECLADFQRTRSYEAEFDDCFANHSKIVMYYEDLARDYAGEMARAQAFLGVSTQAVAPAIYKQSQQSLAEAIANYDALKKRFANSSWQSFFE